MAKLGEVATYINGYAFKPQDWSDKGVPIIRIQDLTGNSYQANRFDGEYDSKYEVNDEDVLISWSASLGVYVWHGEKAVLNQHIFKVVFDKEKISKDFFVHQVGVILENAASNAHGATMKHLTKPVFDSLPFYLPPYEKQCEIAKVLNKVTDLIFLRKQQLVKLDELVKARFVEMFGDPVANIVNWPIERLEKHLTIIGGYAFKSDGFRAKGIPVLRIGNINSGYFQPTNMVYWHDDSTLERYKMHPGDLVISLTGTVGKNDYGNVCILGNDYSEYYLNQRNAKLELNETLNGIYLSELLKFPQIKGRLTGISRGIRQANISNKDILSLPILIPPISLQKQFAAFVERVDQQKQTVQQSLEKLELMKKALMQEYFG